MAGLLPGHPRLSLTSRNKQSVDAAHNSLPAKAGAGVAIARFGDTLFGDHPRLTPEDIRAAQALADSIADEDAVYGEP